MVELKVTFLIKVISFARNPINLNKYKTLLTVKILTESTIKTS